MIDTEALRKKIIELAIQGKLTEQLPLDGNAESLYAKILEEKAKLIKEGKIRKDKDFSPISDDEIPFDKPANWLFVRFATIITLQSGQDLNATDYNADGNGIPYITGASNYRDDGTLIINRWTDVPKAFANKGDILLSCKGTVGKLTILDEGEVHIARQIMGIRTYSVNVRFVRYFVDWMLEEIKSASKGLIPGIERNDVLNLCCPLPPLAEQARIVDKIEEVLTQIDIIDTLQQQYESDLSVLKGKIIDAGIQGKLTEQLPEDGNAEDLYTQILNQKSQLIKEGKIKKEKPLPGIAADEIPFEIPKNWKWVRIADIGLTVTGTTPPKANAEYYGGDYQFFKPSDMDLGRHISIGSESLTDKGWEVSRQLEKGTILVCCIGSIGKCAIIDVDGTTNQQINALTPIICDSDYLLYAFNSDSFQNQLQQGSRATTVTIIKKSKFDECIIPLPPLEEQKRISARIDEMLAMMESCQE